MTSSKIPLAGVIGSPISHSKSPKLHGHWLKTYDIQGYYIPMDIAADTLEKALRSLPLMGFRGVNVTLPHKEKALSIADHVTDRARLIGAANTLTFQPDGSIHADNTDGYGFLANLREGAPDWQAQAGPAVVLGAGGAARAVLVSLLDAGVPKIILTNRTRSRAEILQQDFGPKITVVDWDAIGDALAHAALVVNTTSLGMVGHAEMALPFQALAASTVVTDLVYTPLKTKLLIQAETQGCTIVDGLGMLLHQGVPGFEAWFGHRPSVTNATRNAVLS